MERFARDLRPSALTRVCAPALDAAALAQVPTLGRPAVEIQVRTAPVSPLHVGGNAATKINNYKGTTSAMGEGTAVSTTYEQKVSAARVQNVQVDKVKGGNARGIPPRGRPV